MQAVQLDTSLGESERDALLATYEQVTTAIESRNRWTSEFQRLEEEHANATQTIDVLRAELIQPSVPPELSLEWYEPLEVVESQLDIAQSELVALRNEADALQADRQKRAVRRAQLPARIAELRTQLQELEVVLATPAAAATGKPAADRLLSRARAEAYRAELLAAQEELRGHELLSSVLSVRKRLQEKHLSEAQAKVDALEREAELRRQRETRRAAEEAAEVARLVNTYSEELREEAQRNADLVERSSELARRKEEIASAYSEASRKLDGVKQARSATQERGDELSDAIGALLRRQKALLPNASEYESRARTRDRESSSIRIERMQYEDELAGLANLSAAVADTLSAIDTPTVDLDRLDTEARLIFEDRRRYLDELIDDCFDINVELALLEETEHALADATDDFERFIDERVLWIRSSPQLWRTDFRMVPDAALWLVSPDNWLAAWRALRTDIANSALSYIAMTLVIGALLIGRRRARRVIAETGDVASRRSCFVMTPTWQAVAATMTLCLGYPSIVWFIAVRLVGASDATGFAQSLGQSLEVLALVLLIVEAVRYTSLPNGLGEAHFGWSSAVGRRLRQPLFALPLIAIPLLGVALTLEQQSRDPWKDSLGRVCLIAALLLVMVFLFVQTRQYRRAQATNSWERRIGGIAELASIGLPGALIVLALGGHSFTAMQLVSRLFQTTGLALAVALGYAIANRGLLVTKRRIAIDQARRVRAAKAAESPDSAGSGEPSLEELAVIDVNAVSAQSRQMFGALAFVALVAGCWWIWADVLPALQFFDKIELWSYSTDGPDGSGKQLVPVSLGGLLGALIILLGLFLANRNLPGLLEVSVLQRLSMGPGERYAVKAILRYILAMIGIIWAFGVLGIGWSKVQWLAAAVSVGLGFGLQEIFANFVSGLIILGERPVRVGDWVTAGEVTGKVTRIHMRSTTLVDRDNREWLIPNKELITARLSNWTLSEQVTRVVVPVGVAYGSETEKAVEIMLDIARGTQHVLQNPAPNVVFKSFGDNSLNLELRFFINGRDLYPAILHPVNTEIHDRFKEAGIEIAFPQRDLHIRSAPGLVEVFKKELNTPD